MPLLIIKAVLFAALFWAGLGEEGRDEIKSKLQSDLEDLKDELDENEQSREKDED